MNYGSIKSERDRIWCERFNLKLMNQFKDNLEAIKNKDTILEFIKKENIISNDYTKKTARLYVFLMNMVLENYNVPYYLHSQDFGEQFKTFKNEGYTYDEFYKSLEQFINYQDKLLPALVFEGLTVKEALSIKTKNINLRDNAIKLDNKIFKIKNSDIKYLIEKTMAEKEYESTGNNGMFYALNTNSEYLIKPVPRSTNDNGLAQTKENSIKFRFKKLKAQIGDENISFKNYTLSGASYYLDKYLKENKLEPLIYNIEEFIYKYEVKGTNSVSLKKYWTMLYGE